MQFDIVLPSALFFLTAAAVILYSKLETKVKSIFEEKKFRMLHIVVIVAVMGIAVTVFAVISNNVIQIFFLISYSLLLFLSAYIFTSKWYFGLLLSAIFLASYFIVWNIPFDLANLTLSNISSSDIFVIVFMNVFAAIFVVFASVFMGTLFGWETAAVFAGLITVMDVILVLVTGSMVDSGLKSQSLKLPAMILVPTFPLQNYIVSLGLGDILLSSILTIQTARKYGKRFGYATIVFIAVAFLIFEFLMFQLDTGAMPATVFIDCGWLTALGGRYLYNLLTSKRTVGEGQ